MKYNKITLLLFGFLFIAYTSQAQWKIPEKAKKSKNPHESSDTHISSGKKIYASNCKSCHGDPGKANALLPTATDVGSADYLKMKDGSIYYQITEGMGAMPSFKKSLSDEERWSLVSYIRSLANKEAVEEGGDENMLDKLSLKFEFDKASNSVKASVTDKSGSPYSKAGVPVAFLVKRYFGQMKIGEIETNESGLATLKLVDIKTDEKGNIELSIKINDRDKYGDVKLTQEITIGEHRHFKNILEERALWGSRANIPWWMLFLYVGITGGVWVAIVYVILQIKKVKKLGTQINT